MRNNLKSIQFPPPLSRREQLWVGLAFLLTSLIVVPIFWQRLACGHDFLTHFYRLAQIGLNAQEGVPFFHQWSQHFVRGYGYPIFSFYAPLTYWLAAPFHLAGIEASAALRIVAWLSLYMAGWGAYNLGRCYFQTAASFVVGLAYLFAPYLLFNATQRGAIPELLGLALLPWALCAAVLALSRRTPPTIISAGFVFGLLVLTHNVIPNFGFGMLIVLALIQSRRLTGQNRVWAAAWPALLILFLALGLSLFFWLPALVELAYTQSGQIDAPVATGPHFSQHFLPLTELIRWPQVTADPTLLNPPIYRYLGVGQSLLALLGGGLLLFFAWGTSPNPARLPRYAERALFAWAIILLASLFFTGSYSRWVWLHLPLPELVQLPTRFLGPASLAVALLAGLPVDRLQKWVAAAPSITGKGRLVTFFFVGSGVVVSLSGWPWLYPVLCDVPPHPTADRVAQAMDWNESGSVLSWGGEGLGETLPRWVTHLPEADALIPQYQTGGPPINRFLLPETATLQQWQPQPRGDRYHLTLPTAQTVVYQAFYFPGWQAHVNGQAIPLKPRAGDGLIELTLPAGEVILELWFGPTPLRLATMLFSGLVFLLCLVGWWRRPDPPLVPAERPGFSALWPLLFLVVFLLLLKGVVDNTNNPIRNQRLLDSQLQGVAVPAAISFSGELLHLGYDGPTVVTADEPFTVTQYWQAERDIGVPYGFRLRIADEAGNVWNMPFTRPFTYADFPGLAGWQRGKYARDAYQFQLLPGTPPGIYWLEAEVFRLDIDSALIPANTPTANDPNQARLGQLYVTPGSWSITAENAPVTTFLPIPKPVRPGVTLAGWSAPGDRWQPGDTVPLTLLWTAVSPIAADYMVHLELLSESDERVTTTTLLIGGDTYPTSHWPAGQVVGQQINWQLPAGLDSGQYKWQLQTETQPVILAQWHIEAPPRQFEPPDMAQTVAAAIGPVELVGFTHLLSENRLDLDLTWQTTAGLTERYRVFVHLQTAEGQMVAQSDAEPAQWTRPTTGWVVGEYITDRHTIPFPPDLPPGEYTLFTGLYHAGTGQRLGIVELITLSFP